MDGSIKKEALAVDPKYASKTVNTDGTKKLPIKMRSD